MKKHPHVAVLLATYNGTRFIEPQLRSLCENETPFVLHWLDDHSTDDTRARVRALARELNLDLREWHHAERQGVPNAFFQLLECVVADIYLFCDQDDIWQPGKIDRTVRCLLPEMSEPVLCFSDALMFDDAEPERLQPVSIALDVKAPAVLQESRSFLCTPAPGNTFGFTRPLREVFVKHNNIARLYAGMHDFWMYNLALVAGSAKMLSDAPTTLYRQHSHNTSGPYFKASRGFRGLMAAWRSHQKIRRICARHAKGFLLASTLLPPGPKLDRMISVAQLISQIDRRHSLFDMLRLLKQRVMSPSKRTTMWLVLTCLWSDATA